MGLYGGFSETTCISGPTQSLIAIVRCSEYVHLAAVAPRCDDAILSTSQLLEAPKYFKVLFDCAKSTAHHTNLKKTVQSKSGRSGALLGLNFRVFLLVYGHLRAAGVPIGPL
jgi:hypothetical protein